MGGADRRKEEERGRREGGEKFARRRGYIKGNWLSKGGRSLYSELFLRESNMKEHSARISVLTPKLI